MIIDTHVHLDDKRYIDDLDEVLKRAREGGVERFIIPGADPVNLTRAIEIAESNSDIYFAIGVHPYDIYAFDTLEFEKYINHPKCVAVGECGLDYFRLEGSDEEKDREKKKQKEIFIAQIEIAKKYKKPLIVHIRDASKDSKKILEAYNAKEGFYFGIGGVLTFKNAKKLLHALPKIPQDRLLIETDGPYLTPTPHRGERNEPLYTTFIAKKISELLEIPLEDVKKITTQNALVLFNIS